MPRNKLGLKILDDNGDVRFKFDSIHQFRKIKMRGHLSSYELDKLRNGEVIIVAGEYVCLSSVNHKLAFKKRRAQDRKTEVNVLIRKNEFAPKNIIDSIQKTNRIIVILDDYYGFVSSHSGTIAELSTILKLSGGTIKASLHKTPKQIAKYLSGFNPKKGNNHATGIHFVYSGDLTSLKIKKKKL